MKVFISGPISGVPNYRERFAEAEAELRTLGHVVLNPAALPDGMTQADYMRLCFAMIDVADAVLFLRDSEKSVGSNLEHTYAIYTGKEIFRRTRE